MTDKPTINPIAADDPEAKSADVIAANLEKLKALFPEAVSEDGVNVEVLNQLIGRTVTDVDEKYGLTWFGKRKARQLALTPSTGTLRPCPGESVDWDTTQNLFIEGDNLEVLKLLQKSYANKVKMIYIDPPYNTGKDFVYSDDFQDNIRNYLEVTGQIEGGARVTSNTETSGRFHTDWLKMIYPRLLAARALLSEDGVIFVSIDDSEHGHLRSLCDEVFGEENLCGVIKRRAARKTAFLSKRMTDMCDYVVAYVRTDNAPPLTAGEISDGTRPVFNVGNAVSERILREGAVAKCSDGTYPYGEYAARSLSFTLIDDLVVSDGRVQKEVRISGPWRINQDVLDETLFVTRNLGLRRTMRPEELGKAKLLNDLLDEPSCYNEKGSEELQELLGCSAFSNPKPRDLIEYLMSAASVGPGDVVCDFFAGSGTTGHAVLARAGSDAAPRFVLVQLPEALDPDDDDQKIAAEFVQSLGKPLNLAEVTKERLRRAVSNCAAMESTSGGDLGFRVFKLDTSNIRAWNPDPDDLEGTLQEHTEHLAADRSEADVLYELLLKLGLDLAVPIETRQVAGKDLHSIGAGTLFACLAESIPRDDVEAVAQAIIAWHKELAPEGETTIVFRDSGFADDVAKSNLAAILVQAGFDDTRIRSL